MCIRDRNVRYGTDELAVLDYRAARHSLNYPAGPFEQRGVGHAYRKAPAADGAAVYGVYLNRIFAYLA